jgi:C4-dicarboxylate transporter/malic acid transport protein
MTRNVAGMTIDQAGQIRVYAGLRGWLALANRHIGPAWFTSVMGTGILALCAKLSPIQASPLGALSEALWLADVALLTTLLALWLTRAVRYPGQVFAGLHDPATAHAWGAPPIACFTVATGFLLIGVPMFGWGLCLPCAEALWLLGVVGSLFAVVAVPYLLFTRHRSSVEMTYGNWLLPVVPPIVSSVPGALLVSHWPHSWRSSMLALSYGLWGIGIALAAITIVLIYARLAYHRVPNGALVTTLWIAVGPPGQSIAGINALGSAAGKVWPALGPALRAAGLAYGLPVWGFGMYWLALAILLTLRAARIYLPFSVGWWAFTFPVGVLITGTDALYAQTGAPLFAGAAMGLLALLASTWALVAVRTLHAMADAYRAAAQPRATPVATDTLVA